MSSSSSAATGSRPSSPHTPEPTDSFDPVAIQSDFDMGSWYPSDAENLLSPQSSWHLDSTLQIDPQKYEEGDQILHLDDLIQQNAYDDSPSPLFTSPELPSKSDLDVHQTTFALSNPSSFHPSSLFTANERVLATKPVPPPASLPRKHDPSTNIKVVYPPKDSCYNLPIMFPSLPEGGTKSRVETQVRVTVDLADSSSSSDPTKYDRVGSWKWLQLPRGTATKRRTRKQGKIDPDAQDILRLTATVTCASAPHNRVYSCTTCQTREVGSPSQFSLFSQLKRQQAKRVAKKLASRVRPTRSDSESGDDAATKSTKGKQQEDTTSIIQFNCAEIQDFSSGSVVLPLRITCYCRHHREKVGFSVHFAMMDHNGRIVGSGISKPIMITDDHKTPATKSSDVATGISTMDFEWSKDGPTKAEPGLDARAPSKRKKDASKSSGGKKRAKPYDVASKPGKRSRETSVADSHPSPSSSYAETRPPTPTVQAVPPLQPSLLESDSSGDAPATPPDYPDIPMMAAETPETPTCLPFTAAAPPVNMQQSLPFVFFDATQPSQSLTFPLPTIHRLIPNCGPTHGGTEVTILGANFHPSLQLDCVFGDVVAGSTQRWSDNTLVCILPPRATPGVVAVWFNNFPKVDDSTSSSTSLFTYSDESDRALMELALQVVGLKMTGKIEDAKNVAMRIVGNVGNEGSDMQSNSTNTNTIMQVTSAARSLRPLLLGQTGEGDSFENKIIKFLSILETPLDLPGSRSISLSDAISHPAPSSGQTLLHLASFLGFNALVGFLVDWDADLDTRDRNGYTALHFAAIAGSSACAATLLRAGADPEIVNALGKTPQEIAVREGLFDVDLYRHDILSTDISGVDEDEEAVWGDAEEDSDDSLQRNAPRRIVSRRTSKRTPRRVVTPRSSTSSLTSPPEVPQGIDDDKQAATLFAMIQRTLAQLPAPQLRRMPGLPMPAVPWAALPQLPMVFPVFVPWPAKGIGAASFRAAQELRGTWEAWEKWLALALAGAARQREESPPPMYTPRETQREPSALSDELAENVDTAAEPAVGPEASQEVPSSSRHVSYTSAPRVVTEQEVNAYGYLPAEAPKKRVFPIPLSMVFANFDLSRRPDALVLLAPDTHECVGLHLIIARTDPAFPSFVDVGCA
ncbi:hypothetical protein DFH07DRAFT_866218 [Mycena maculata]|uniref:IPT/TIG domain-containing protein n=1 Tax=Mycena maculata TaxID=230809 RepID=A0AAD7JVJ4_9AGAR|nr:hypothetical protein DFH07DRAFT_866218 [Mycena maculata]